MSAALTIVFWMDHPSTINPKKDTTYLLIHECLTRGHAVYVASKSSFFVKNQQLNCHAIQMLPFELGATITRGHHHLLSHTTIDVVWLRCDPPVDLDYIHHMWLFEQFSNDILFMNHPRGILTNNEKIAALNFPKITPKTMVTKTKATIYSFLESVESIILKPLDGFGGSGIFRFNSGDTNLDPAIEQLTNHGQNYLIAQEALNHTTGDKRILLLNGRPIGAVLRLAKESHRNNFMAGGHAIATQITDGDDQIIQSIRSFLMKHHLHFVGIDIIENYLIEINVTSPTCMQEINMLTKSTVQKQVIDVMECMLN